MPKYEFPSQIKVDPSEIEKPLRRGFRTRNNYKDVIIAFLILVIMLEATACYYYVGNVIDTQKARADKVINQDSALYDSFCSQAKADRVASGEKESEALINLCGK